MAGMRVARISRTGTEGRGEQAAASTRQNGAPAQEPLRLIESIR
jgi:hypothetical protein